MTIELIDAPSHETQGLWVNGEKSELSTDQAHTGVQSMYAFSQDGSADDGSGDFRQNNISFIAGQEYTIKVHVFSAPGHSLSRIRISLIWSDFSTTEIVNALKSTFTSAVWTPFSKTFTAPSSAADLVVVAVLVGLPVLARSDWYIDTWSLPQEVSGAAMKGKWDAIQKLTTLLKSQIVGPPSFHLDIGGRVYNRLVLPHEHEGILLPYLCVPVLLEAQSYPAFDRLTQTQWQQEIMCFVTEAAAHDTLKTTGARDICHIHDDVIKAILSDIDLGGFLNAPMQLTSNDSISGVTDEDFAENSMKFQMGMNFGKDDLGPAA